MKRLLGGICGFLLLGAICALAHGPSRDLIGAKIGSMTADHNIIFGWRDERTGEHAWLCIEGKVDPVTCDHERIKIVPYRWPF